jgi:hypothetical protein
MSAVLDVVARPKLLGSSVVALVQEEVERLQNQSLVSFLTRLSHAACFLVSGWNLKGVTRSRHSGKRAW